MLDNQAQISAQTDSGEGGNITLNVGDLLALRRQSQISTTAGVAYLGGSGGKINIDAPNGFIVAPLNDQNDIFSNAYNGSGGMITINAFGLLGIEKLSREEAQDLLKTKPLTQQDLQTLPGNYITAFSQTQPKLDGVLNINAPNLDPTHGLIQLPADLGDSSRLIAQSCPVGGQRATSQFIVTGRGGLPPNPSSALSSETFLGNAAAIALPPRENPSPSASVPLQEAQGVEIGSKGEILLTARPSTLNSSTSVKKFRGCYGK